MKLILTFLFYLSLLGGTQAQIPVLLDTDANNELDDQHAIAYMLFNSDVFEIIGITVNTTNSGGGIDQHVEEAERVVELCGYKDKVQVIPGASKDFKEVLPNLNQSDFDGNQAVDFIIRSAHEQENRKLVVVPIGTLTNVALALAKDSSIAPLIRVVWLGSNWPEPGEYNLDNDTTAINPVINNRQLELEICTVHYGQPSGTAAVDVSVSEIQQKMPGLGPEQQTAVAGRHGGKFYNFGDYSIELFENIGDERRPLFDVCALAIIKDPRWAKPKKVPAPKLQGNAWVERPRNSHHVIFWENFNREAILNDFYQTMEQAGE
jgi:inosine-uridine nucleoside N-ribohydrolase